MHILYRSQLFKEKQLELDVTQAQSANVQSSYIELNQKLQEQIAINRELQNSIRSERLALSTQIKELSQQNQVLQFQNQHFLFQLREKNQLFPENHYQTIIAERDIQISDLKNYITNLEEKDLNQEKELKQIKENFQFALLFQKEQKQIEDHKQHLAEKSIDGIQKQYREFAEELLQARQREQALEREVEELRKVSASVEFLESQISYLKRLVAHQIADIDILKGENELLQEQVMALKSKSVSETAEFGYKSRNQKN